MLLSRLREDLEESGAIIHWSSYEKTVIEKAARDLRYADLRRARGARAAAARPLSSSAAAARTYWPTVSTPTRPLGFTLMMEAGRARGLLRHRCAQSLKPVDRALEVRQEEVG